MAAALAIAVAGAAVPGGPRDRAGPKGRIVCWKDKSGKVVGCGDKVPPEYQDSATREMDARGVTRGTTESAEEADRRRAQEQEAAKVKAEEAEALAEQKRQDTALLNTYTSEKEIDQKRDRDLQQAGLPDEQLKVSLKNATERYNEAKARSDAAAKDKKPVRRAEGRARQGDQPKSSGSSRGSRRRRRRRKRSRQRYAEQKKRYLELRGAAAPQLRAQRGAGNAASAARTTVAASSLRS